MIILSKINTFNGFDRRLSKDGRRFFFAQILPLQPVIVFAIYRVFTN
jgi:hypothetical protein